MKNYIESIGVEIEGGGDIYYIDEVVRKFNDSRIDVGTDSSVYVECKYDDCECEDDDYDCDCCRDWRTSLEIRYWIYIHELEKLYSFIDQLFEYLYQDYSCGNHIHIRLKDDIVYIVTLYADSFVKAFTRHYVKFAKSFKDKDLFLYERLMRRLNNRYCKKYRNEWDLYFNVTGVGNRYKIVNFISLYERQKTIEFRIFPFVIRSSELKQFIDFLIITVNKIVDRLVRVYSVNPISVEQDLLAVENPIMIEGEVDVF